ncbi:hypothetical protein [Macellibacteroides fermentans]|uniref:Uncharacterized protein n=1 Tax=Parabacteroides chartae TaxID=1037355 RepID=A0A1T5BTA2_9BACT|nr:hypothetical protein [Parabacteroides chartae]SKB50384.1 hypothetical protein SAMN05660349_01492 [Parabacteroides chartae]
MGIKKSRIIDDKQEISHHKFNIIIDGRQVLVEKTDFNAKTRSPSRSGAKVKTSVKRISKALNRANAMIQNGTGPRIEIKVGDKVINIKSIILRANNIIIILKKADSKDIKKALDNYKGMHQDGTEPRIEVKVGDKVTNIKCAGINISDNIIFLRGVGVRYIKRAIYRANVMIQNGTGPRVKARTRHLNVIGLIQIRNRKK